MKFAIASQNFRTVTAHAGRARRFLVYQAEPGGEPVELERLDLPKDLSMHEFHGRDEPHPLDQMDVLIAGGAGPGFAERMAKRGITAVTTTETDPVTAIKLYLADALPPGTACGHDHDHEHDPADEHEHGHGVEHGHKHRHGHGHG